MSHAEFVEWSAFAEVEPLPATRGDIQTAMLMMLMSVIWGKKGSKPKLKTFIPDWWGDRRSPRALAAKFRAMTAHMQPDEQAEPEKVTRG